MAATIVAPTIVRRTVRPPPATSPPRNRGRLAHVKRSATLPAPRRTDGGCAWTRNAAGWTPAWWAMTPARTRVRAVWTTATTATSTKTSRSARSSDPAIATGSAICSAVWCDSTHGNVSGSWS